MAQTGTTLYAVLKPLIKFGAFLFYKKIEVSGVEKLKGKKSVILIANHQNAMLDPVICCLYSNRQLHWLTRADVFKKGFVKQLLHKFNMLPVYRERDNVDDLRGKNEQIFGICFDRLKSGAVISMFPEGTHRGKKQLHNLRKGMARMAFGALDSGVEELYIVPVGLDYSDYYNSQGEVLLQFGEPIRVNEYLESFTNDAPRTLTRLMEDSRKALSDLMIDIREDQWYDDLMGLERFVHNMSEDNQLRQRVNRFKRFCNAAQQHPEKWKVIHDLKRKYLHLSKDLLIEEEYLVRENVNPVSMFLMGLVHLVFGLLALPAFLVYSPFNIAVENFVKTRLKDPLFYNSIRLVFWVFGSPLWTLLIAALPTMFYSGNVGFGYRVLLLLASGIVATKWWPFFKKWRMTWRLFWQSRNHKDKFAQWLETRHALRNTIADIIK